MYLLVFHTNLLWWAAAPLNVSAPAAAADAIVVFAGGVGESGKAGGGAQERLKQAVDLYKAGAARSWCSRPATSTAFARRDVMRALAIDQGVPAAHIVLEQHAANTYQNVTFVDEILQRARVAIDSARQLAVSHAARAAGLAQDGAGGHS